MRETDITEAGRDGLTDIGDIQIDESLEAGERLAAFMEQAHNPYLLRAGDYIVKLEYADCEKDMEDRMLDYISGLARIQG